MKYYLAILSIAVFSIYCTRKKTHPAIEEQEKIAKIYCWCFQSFSKQAIDTEKKHKLISCQTFNKVKPAELILPKYLMYQSLDTSKVNALDDLLFENVSHINDVEHAPDARMIILLKRSRDKPDTLVYSNDNTFCFNGRKSFHYTFDILDSLKRVLKKSEIICEN